ncbi:hypothetical protein BDZ94DRAFT_1312588 [Collybia nuda]|uniref:Uncharacterized protein n=1 Tax=Collybia nuda TaxID=64659 RepID=A0A9P5XX48_9AGAR|nr:hypothetical protein BDZ94DRAFT_1312588 [Collybia nuda]
MSSANQTSPDSVASTTIGIFLITGSVEITTFNIIYGIFALLFAQSATAFLRRRLSSRPHMCMFLISAFSFVLATLHGAALLVDACAMAQVTLIRNQDLLLDERLELAYLRRGTPVLLMIWTSALGPIVSDSIVVWRAFVLFRLQRKRWVVILPLLLLLASIAMSLANAVLASMGRDFLSGLVNTTFLMGIRLSLAANVVATALFGYIYWLHKKTMAPHSLERCGPTPMVRVLAVFMESGVAFCVPQAIYVILVAVPQHYSQSGQYIQSVFVVAYFAFALLYPTVVIVLVNRRYTLDQYLSDPSLLSGPNLNGMAVLQPMAFAPPEATVNTKGTIEQDETEETYV